jgi:hypothetical protein
MSHDLNINVFLLFKNSAATVDSQWQHCDGNTESVYLGKDQVVVYADLHNLCNKFS